MASDTWWRFYNTAPDHPKILRLNDAQFRAWTIMNSLASKMGGEVPDDFNLIAQALRKPVGKARDLLQALLSVDLWEKTETGFRPHNWHEKQFKSDVSTTRVKRFRERKRNVSETHQSTETDATLSLRSSVGGADAPSPSKRAIGHRWPSEQKVPESWIFDAREQFKALGRSPPDLEVEAIRFANYWAAKSGKDAARLDWKKTWVNWVLGSKSNGSGQRRQTPHEAFAEGAYDAGREFDARRGIEN
jgi:hypothetical protein